MAGQPPGGGGYQGSGLSPSGGGAYHMPGAGNGLGTIGGGISGLGLGGMDGNGPSNGHEGAPDQQWWPGNEQAVNVQ